MGTAVKREAQAVKEAGSVTPSSDGEGGVGERVEFGNGEVVPVKEIVKEELKAEGVSAMGINFVGEGADGVGTGSGRTVRELSRLWRYTRGRVPGASGVV